MIYSPTLSGTDTLTNDDDDDNMHASILLEFDCVLWKWGIFHYPQHQLQMKCVKTWLKNNNLLHLPFYILIGIPPDCKWPPTIILVKWQTWYYDRIVFCTANMLVSLIVGLCTFWYVWWLHFTALCVCMCIFFHI